MAERTVRDAAVEAMAGARCNRVGHFVVVEPPCGWCRDVAKTMLDALVASVEVRAGLVAAYYAQDGRWYEAEAAHKPDGSPIAGLRLWPLADVTLAALGGTEAT